MTRPEADAQGIVIQGNEIGTDSGGALPLGNGGDGVHIQDNASVNTIGGAVAKDGNTIAFNGGAGVSINDNAVSDEILTNSIFSNGGQGIVLSGDGNALQVAPSLTSAVGTGTSTSVTGTITASPNTTYQVQFFADPSGHGQGETFLVVKAVTTNVGGVASFTVAIKSAVAAGDVISATATSPAGNTSGFSADVPVMSGTTSSARSAAVAVPAVTMTDLGLGAPPTWSSSRDDAVLIDLAGVLARAKNHHADPGIVGGLGNDARM